MAHGVFIVIEGTDGSGKGTQTDILHKRLEGEGYSVEVFDFPRYGQSSAYFVEQYLNGKFGELASIDAYKGSLFYALDRYAASFAIRQAVEAGKVVISNRYVGSNMGHQGGKLPDDVARRKYFEWNEHLEFSILGIPRPDLNLVLHVPAEMAQKLVDRKETRSYTAKQRDLHEADLDHLRNAENAYLQMCDLFPKVFTKIECSSGGDIDSVDDISQRIWKRVAPLLGTHKGGNGAE